MRNILKIPVFVFVLTPSLSSASLLNCWIPDSREVVQIVTSIWSGQTSTAFSIMGRQIQAGFSRCVFGESAETRLLQAALSGDINSAQRAYEELTAPKLNPPAQTKLAIEPAKTPPVVDTITNENGETPLHIAAAKGNVALVTLLTEKGAAINPKDKNGYTPLMLATARGHGQIVEILLAKGADANAASESGTTALMLAASDGLAQITDLLIQNNANVNLVRHDGFTALMLAARNGRVEVVKGLIKASADLNVAKKDGWTALMLAAYNGRHSIVKLLTDHDADVLPIDDKGISAKEYALKEGHGKSAHIIDIATRRIAFTANLKTVLAKMSPEEVKTLWEEISTFAKAPPEGPYQAKCIRITVEKNHLIADCLGEVGLKRSSLELPCGLFIDNDNGKLVCIPEVLDDTRMVPHGPFSKTCSDCHVDRKTLYCKCRIYTVLNDVQLTSLALPCKGKVENRYGNLKCEI